jgi:uncharacterized protein YoxC
MWTRTKRLEAFVDALAALGRSSQRTSSRVRHLSRQLTVASKKSFT